MSFQDPVGLETIRPPRTSWMAIRISKVPCRERETHLEGGGRSPTHQGPTLALARHMAIGCLEGVH